MEHTNEIGHAVPESLPEVLSGSLQHALMIALFVFVMMVLVDFLNVISKGRMNKIIKGGKVRQYTTASLLGATPGCLGAFTNVSFYAHGFIGFGAIVGGMIATSGDEAFVMLSMFPKTALLMFGLLFVLGILGAWLADKTAKLLKLKVAQNCHELAIHKDEPPLCFDPRCSKKLTLHRLVMIAVLLATVILTIMGVGSHHAGWGWERISFLVLILITLTLFFMVSDHYIRDHIYKHIAKVHLPRIFLWSLFAILFVHMALEIGNLETFIEGHMIWVLVAASLLAIVPESGPHLIFVMFFVEGTIPFSVLLASSIVQDGHGMLPMLSVSLKDSAYIKIFNLIFGLLIGGGLYLIGF